MLRRFGYLLGTQATIFGIVTGYDQLADEIIQKWVDLHGWAAEDILLLYWGIPILIFFAGEASWRFIYRGYWQVRIQHSRWKLRRILRLSISESDTTDVVISARNKGLLNRDEAKILLHSIKGLEPIDFEILVLLDAPVRWVNEYEIILPQEDEFTYAKLFSHIFSLPKDRKDICLQSIERLNIRGLIYLNRGSYNLIMSRNEVLKSVTTPNGHKVAFLVKDAKRY